MNSIGKCTTVFLLVVSMLLGLSACGGVEEDDIITLVSGNIDEIYLGKHNDAYLQMVDSTAEEAQQAYLEGLEVEAEYFVNYWGIVDSSLGEVYTDLDESFRSEVVEMYKEIYSHTKYEIQSVTKQDDGSYEVKVLIDPIDVMRLAEEQYMNNTYEPLNAFWEKYDEVDISMMTDEEYMDYTHEYGEAIVQLVKDQIPNLGYTEQKSQTIQVEEDDNGVLSINKDDWGIFDSHVIYYP